MAKQVINKGDWMEIPENSLKGSHKAAYQAVRKAREELAKARSAFEDGYVAEARAKGALESGETLMWSYNFGRISVAKASATSAKPATQKRQFKI